MTHDLFNPPTERVDTDSLEWTQVYISTLGVTYRWRLVPGTPLDRREGPPEGFCLEYATGRTFDGEPIWAPVRNVRRRERVWVWLLEKGAVGT